MKITQKIVLSLLCAGFSVITAWGMKVAAPVARADQITLVSADGKEVMISRKVAELSGTIQNLLASPSISPFKEAKTKKITLSLIEHSLLLDITTILNRVKKELRPRKIDGQYAPYKVQLIVDEVLKDTSFIHTKNMVLAANFLDIPFLINAVARVLVYKATAQVQQIVQEQNFRVILPELHIYLKKHLSLKAADVTKEWSIVDLIEENPEKIKLDKTKLDLSDLGLTSLDGLEKIDEKIKKGATELLLNRNRLTSIAANAFQGLSNLRRFHLSSNRLTSIAANAFQGLNNLQELYLSNNQLTSIAANVFQGLNNLQRFYLDNNQLTSIEANTFQGLNNLLLFYLSNNQLTSIAANTFQGLNNLQALYLDNNQLTNIPTNVFQGLDNLQRIDLSSNRLASIAVNAFQELNNLLFLYLGSNQMTSIAANTFQGLNSLQGLYLDNNQLTSIEANTFQGLNNLLWLYLSNNQLTSIAANVFKGLNNLGELELYNNRLSKGQRARIRAFFSGRDIKITF
ncbi:MAG: leucine-rich repeat protein [bacterium]|nr:leucine-rich repeat protein [bacterium]